MPPSPQLSEDAGTKYALIIGVDTFRDPKIPALRYAQNDATAMRDFLLHSDLGKFQREDVHMLLEGEATVGDIRSQFVYWLGAKVQEADHVWIYFAGYGACTREGKHYLLAHDTVADDLAQTAIALTDLQEWLGLISARRIALILDCGFSGMGRGRTLVRNKNAAAHEYGELEALTQDSRYVALVATSPNENAREDDDAELGLYTRILLQHLRAKLLAPQTRELTWDGLQQFLAAEVARQADLRGTAQTPLKFGGLPGTTTIFGAAPNTSARATTTTTATATTEISQDERVKQLLREAQQAIYEDDLARARALLLEIVDFDASNRRALSGLRKLDEALQKNTRESQIKQAFAEAQRQFDERNYQDATRWYSKVLELDPTSESARVGIETCQTMLLRQNEASTTNGGFVAARATAEKPIHAPKMDPYEEFIWPYVGWWALVAAVWALFGTHTENASNATIFVTVVKYSFFGALIGVVHASAVYFYQLRAKVKKARRT